MKKHWIRTLCNGMKKPTGQTGEVGDRIHWCMVIEKKIMQIAHSGMMGFSSLEDESTPNGGGWQVTWIMPCGIAFLVGVPQLVGG
jgi:hypothetical protein